MPPPPVTPTTINEYGDETHPSFGVVKLSRVTSQPPAHLFDSSIGHTHYVSMTVVSATRRRDMHRDWIYAESRPIVTVNMSMAQWGALVSSFNDGSGTPVTLTCIDGKQIERAEHTSRLAETAREVSAATKVSTEEIGKAVQAVLDAFEARAGRREMTQVLHGLRAAVSNLPSNMKFAGDALTRHAEDVVTKASADIEAARQFGAGALGIDTRVTLELEGPENGHLSPQDEVNPDGLPYL